MFIIEGNIGVGKTTFLRCVHEVRPDIRIVREPVQLWDSKEHGTSLLQRFGEDPQRWAYTMETYTLMQRVASHAAVQDDAAALVMERSIYSGYHVFAHNSYKQGFMNPCEWGMYARIFADVAEPACRPPHGIIYLRSRPSVAYDRMRVRSRESESGVPLAYLEQIHARYEELFARKDAIPALRHVPLLTIDVDEDFVEDSQCAERMVNEVTAFIGSHTTCLGSATCEVSCDSRA